MSKAVIPDYELRYFQDEYGEIIDEIQLRTEFDYMVSEGENLEESFDDYFENCTCKNGTLTEVFQC